MSDWNVVTCFDYAFFGLIALVILSLVINFTFITLFIASFRKCSFNSILLLFSVSSICLLIILTFMIFSCPVYATFHEIIKYFILIL